MKEFIKSVLDRSYTYLVHHPYNKSLITLQSMEYERLKTEIKVRTPLNIALKGYKVYSQNDEDGIIHEIFSNISGNRTFVEIGIQDGTECNSLALLLNDWKGVWIEGSEKHCNKIRTDLNGDDFPGKLKILNSFIDAQNISSLMKEAASFLAVDQVDLFSLDIDGNDYFIIEQMFNNGIRPKVICIEYNGKFPPPLRVKIRYNPSHVWDLTEYQGASLQTYNDLFQRNGYTLLCCNVIGINAFYIENSLLENFTTYSIEELYQPCRYHLAPMMVGLKPSLRFLKETIQTRSTGE